MNRLDSVSLTLAEGFRRATPGQQREAARVACELVASQVELEGEGVAAALHQLRHGGAPDPALRPPLEALAARLDDAYFLLDEDGDAAKKPEALRLFSKARAASALAFALCEDAGQLHEALYEAVSAVDAAEHVVQRVAEALQRPS